MPELPEVETVKNTLIKEVKDKIIVSASVYWENIIAYPSVKEFERKMLVCLTFFNWNLFLCCKLTVLFPENSLASFL